MSSMFISSVVDLLHLLTSAEKEGLARLEDSYDELDVDNPVAITAESVGGKVKVFPLEGS